MDKKVVGWVVLGVVTLVVGYGGFTAASVGSEASKMDSLLKESLKAHVDRETLRANVTAQGYTVTAESPALTADGPRHSFVVTTIGLTLKADFDGAGKMSGYHLDRG